MEEKSVYFLPSTTDSSAPMKNHSGPAALLDCHGKARAAFKSGLHSYSLILALNANRKLALVNRVRQGTGRVELC